MASILDEMSRSMADDPAGGFGAFLADHEDRTLDQISLNADEERRIGSAMQTDYLRQAAAQGVGIANDPRGLAYLRELVESIAPRMARRGRYPKLSVTLIDSPIADAQAFPGGLFVFTTAVLSEPDEATVAGIVAHELAHLDLGHLDFFAKRIKLASRGFAPDAGQGFGFGPGGFDLDAMMDRGLALGSQFANPFRPEQELAADCRATTWMFLEGYDPSALAEFFERLHARQGVGPNFPVGMQSHPPSLARRAEVLKRLAQLRRWRPGSSLGRYPDRLKAREAQKRTRAIPQP